MALNFVLSVGARYMFKKWLARKAKAAIVSTTVGVAGGILGAGVWLSNNPQAFAFLGDYQGLALSIVNVEQVVSIYV